MHTVGTGDGGELVAVGTAWSQDGESNFLVSGFREGQGHSHPAGEVVSSALTPHSLFLSYKRARRAQCVLPRDEERWARQPELSNGAGRTGWDRGVGGGAVPSLRGSEPTSIGAKVLPTLQLRAFPSCCPGACDCGAASCVNSMLMSVYVYACVNMYVRVCAFHGFQLQSKNPQ